VVRRCMSEGLVGGEGFAVDASLIQADANKQRSVPGAEWDMRRHGRELALGGLAKNICFTPDNGHRGLGRKLMRITRSAPPLAPLGISSGPRNWGERPYARITRPEKQRRGTYRRTL